MICKESRELQHVIAILLSQEMEINGNQLLQSFDYILERIEYGLFVEFQIAWKFKSLIQVLLDRIQNILKIGYV
jgi:hypothetical protein